MIGSVYLSKNTEIAIWIKKSIKDYKMGIQKKVLEEVITKFTRKKYFVNLNPRNKKMINFYKKNGFKLIYFTFELEGKKDENSEPIILSLYSIKSHFEYGVDLINFTWLL
jgi:hypothetical protein